MVGARIGSMQIVVVEIFFRLAPTLRLKMLDMARGVIDLAAGVAAQPALFI